MMPHRKSTYTPCNKMMFMFMHHNKFHIPNKNCSNAINKALSDILQPYLKLECKTQKLAIALSGGLDSMALLHAIFQHKYYSKLSLKLYALYIHQGLHQDENQWQQFCKKQAESRGIIFLTKNVLVKNQNIDGMEQAARKVRYPAFLQLCKQYELPILLTAHHQDDQVETILLQLLRGAGPAGLASMPKMSLLCQNKAEHSQEKIQLLRPFLEIPQTTLIQYAKEHSLDYINDDSNQNLKYARNAFRHQVTPHLANIRSGYRNCLTRAAKLQAEANELLLELAKLDLDNLNLDHKYTCAPKMLSCERLRQLNIARARNALRYWLALHNLRAPSFAKLNELLKQFVHNKHPSRLTVLRHHDYQLSVQDQCLYLAFID